MFTFEEQGIAQYEDSRILKTVTNATTQSLPRGACVAYIAGVMGGQTTVAADCFNVTIPTTNFLDLVAGVVANKTNYNTGTSAPSTSIAPGAVGFIVTHGLADYAYYNIAASSLGSIGDKIVPVAGSTNLAYAAAGDGRDGLFCNLSTIASATASQAGVLTNVFVRAM